MRADRRMKAALGHVKARADDVRQARQSAQPERSMGVAPIRLTVVATHPVQYMAPWFRHITAQCPQIDLTVLYASRPSEAQQGTGFDRAFAWDLPLLDGYR